MLRQEKRSRGKGPHIQLHPQVDARCSLVREVYGLVWDSEWGLVSAVEPG